jgi:hypothetical protein
MQTLSILLELRLLKKQKGGNVHGRSARPAIPPGLV